LQFETVMAQATAAGLPSTKNDVLRAGQKVWTLEENLIVFIDSLDRLSKRMLEMKAAQDGGAEPIITFDKDDEDTLDFVAASANIRSALFGIDKTSRFDIKQMAGNIIPAIATTNAIVAGLCVLEGFKILKGAYDQVKEIFLMPHAKSNRLLGASKPMPTNPKCPVCSVHQTTVSVDLSRATLNDLVEDFLRIELHYGEKELVVNNDGGLLYDVDETDNLSRKLSDLGITAGTMLTIIDEDDLDPWVNVVINIEEQPSDAPAEKPIEFVGQPNRDIPRRPKVPPPAAPKTNGHPKAQAIESNMVIDLEESSRKRPRSDDVEQSGVKRAKTEKEDKDKTDDEPITIDDTLGAIVILDD
jgi:ubiquitin-like 1-activating enzyme E1 B